MATVPLYLLMLIIVLNWDVALQTLTLHWSGQLTLHRLATPRGGSGYLPGLVEGKPSRLKSRILKGNGIQTRHYAIDSSHRTTHSNADMAVAAARKCLDESPVPARSIGMLSCATTQGDMVVPGFGSMVQAGPECRRSSC